MNLVLDAPGWILAILVTLLLAAAVEDAARLRISNLTSVGVLAAALLCVAVTGFSTELWQNAVAFALLLAAGTLIFAAGKMGGGDVKLLSALGAWFDLKAAIWLLVAVLMIGGLLALVFLGARLVRGEGLKRDTRGGIPYGLAIVGGAAATFATQLGLL